MSSADFPANDLLGRRLQTSLTIVTLTLSVASTLFLLLFSSRLGLGYSISSRRFNAGVNGNLWAIHPLHRRLGFCRRRSSDFLHCFLDDGAKNPRFRVDKSCRVPKQPCCRILHDRTLNSNACRLCFRHSFRFCGRFCCG